MKRPGSKLIERKLVKKIDTWGYRDCSYGKSLKLSDFINEYGEDLEFNFSHEGGNYFLHIYRAEEVTNPDYEIELARYNSWRDGRIKELEDELSSLKYVA